MSYCLAVDSWLMNNSTWVYLSVGTCISAVFKNNWVSLLSYMYMQPFSVTFQYETRTKKYKYMSYIH